MPFTNPIVGGLKLIRAAIQSPNYVAGSEGWSINRAGDAEFNDATVRGTLEAGNTTVDSTGFHLDLSNGGTVDIDNNAFKVTSADASYVAIGTDESIGSYIALAPDGGGGLNTAAQLFCGPVGSAPALSISGPSSDFPYLRLIGSDGTSENAFILNADSYTITDNTNGATITNGDTGFAIRGGTTNNTGTPYTMGQTGIKLVSFSSAASNSVTVTFPVPFSSGVTPSMAVNIASAGAETARWQARAISVSNTQFTLFCFKGDNADVNQAWSNVPVHWTASVPAS